LMDSRAAAAAGVHASAVVSLPHGPDTASFSASRPSARRPGRIALRAAKSFPLRAVKVGMVGTRPPRRRSLVAAHRSSLVLDPVRAPLPGAASFLVRVAAYPAAAPAAACYPNLPRGRKAAGSADRLLRRCGEGRGRALRADGASVVLKGGHFPWRGDGERNIVFSADRPRSCTDRRTRGDPHCTGCALAAAIAARIATTRRSRRPGREIPSFELVAGRFPRRRDGPSLFL